MPTLSGSGNNKNKRWLFHNPTDFIILLLLAIALFAIGFSVNEVFISKNGMFDENVFAFISPFVTASRTEFFQFISFFGKHSFLIPAYLVLLACYYVKRNKLFFVKVFVIALGSLGLMLMLKLIIHRARPADPLLKMVSGYSFPSGHALMSMVFYGLLIYIIRHELKNRLVGGVISIFLMFLILMIGFSRIYLRVHYATDVIAGLAIGFIWLFLSLGVINRINNSWKKINGQHLN